MLIQFWSQSPNSGGGWVGQAGSARPLGC
jgi:hypothetical protein